MIASERLHCEPHDLGIDVRGEIRVKREARVVVDGLSMAKRQVPLGLRMDRGAHIRVLHVAFDYPIVRFDDVSQCGNPFHLEMCTLSKRIDPLRIQNGAYLVWFLDRQQFRKELIVLIRTDRDDVRLEKLIDHLVQLMKLSRRLLAAW